MFNVERSRKSLYLHTRTGSLASARFGTYRELMNGGKQIIETFKKDFQVKLGKSVNLGQTCLRPRRVTSGVRPLKAT